MSNLHGFDFTHKAKTAEYFFSLDGRI